MFFTYLIRYSHVDEFDNIEFCAKSQKEAIKLFNNWCIEDCKLIIPVPIESIEVIYDEDDALEYGAEYGLAYCGGEILFKK